MARRKNQPEAVKVKCRLSERLREIRIELFGDRGGSEMARRLNVPIRTWYNYESGVTVPAEVLLRFMELTGVEPTWLLHGKGLKYRASGYGVTNGGFSASQVEGSATAQEGSRTVESLLRIALRQLEQQTDFATSNIPSEFQDPGSVRPQIPSKSGLQQRQVDRIQKLTSEWPYRADPAGWLDAEREGRCVCIDGDAMVPLVADGARVAYSPHDEAPEALEGTLVVAWVDETPVVRWFRRSGRYGLLRAENPEHVPSILLVDLDASEAPRRLRRVLWIGTPHGLATSAPPRP